MIDQLNTWLTQPSGILVFFGAALILVGVGAIVWLAVTWPKPAPVEIEHHALPLAYVQPEPGEEWFPEAPKATASPYHQPLKSWVTLANLRQLDPLTVLIPPVTDEVAPIAASLGDVPTIRFETFTEGWSAERVARAKELKP